ncbi:MAG: glutamate formimidoyltransferase [Anaerolineales bacterium]|nr:glutamate formimidoyltransferase [Anaerolineales bacterium]
MTIPIVECVANYSDARRPEVIEAILQAITSVPKVEVLDRHSDNDHNRTVITFAGPPEEIAEAAFRSIAKAAELIDLDRHTGEHPRIGASDVVPFVPISGVTMQDCVEIARKVGRRVGEELGIPVYLYEEAATRPERKNLENIRRGQYEALKEEMGVKPERDPDFGPKRAGKAGATVIGARQFLIAYNVYLTTDDVSIAKKIAKAIRQSSGGLRYLKALGMLVEGWAQVSMNMTNFHETPVFRIVEMIRCEAARYGVSIHHSELVGLIPEEALVDTAVWYLQLDQFEKDQVVETRLRAALQEQEKVTAAYGFLDELAAGTAAPGGGSASAYSGAAAAALTAMVARLTIGKKKYAEVEEQMKLILEQAEMYRSDLTTAVEQDAAAFSQVMDAFKKPKDTPEAEAVQQKAIQAATLQATRVPLSVARQSVQVMELALQALTHGNLNAISDAGVAATQAQAALTGAGYNVRINLPGLNDATLSKAMLDELIALEKRAQELQLQARDVLNKRGGLHLD